MKTGQLPASRLKVTLVDPRTGELEDRRIIKNRPGMEHQFKLPSDGENQDWVIILDVVSSS